MKKLLGIIVLGLLLSGNVIAATPFTYLSCKQIIKENKSEDAFGKQEFLNKGKYASHILYKFKDLKKKTTITVYQVGEYWEKDWKSKKPKQIYKSKFIYDKKDSIYSDGEIVPGSALVGYAIQNINGEYFQTTVFQVKFSDGISINDFHLKMDSKCEIVDKKNFNKLIKNGIN
jgi:hypothetical protein